MFRLERIQAVGKDFLTCGDYQQEIARIRCTNPDYGLVGVLHLLDHATGVSTISVPSHARGFIFVWDASPRQELKAESRQVGWAGNE